MHKASASATPGRHSSEGSSDKLTGVSEWSAEELAILRQSLIDYPRSSCSNMFRYVRIASLLPNKNIRQVATKIHSMSNNQIEISGDVGDVSTKKRRLDLAPGQFINTSTITVTQTELNKIFEENDCLLKKIRDNVIATKLSFNHPLMSTFHDNYQQATHLLSQLNAGMPPLPVAPNASFTQLMPIQSPRDNQIDI